MEIVQAQKDVRQTFLGGFAGQLVSASHVVCIGRRLHLAFASAGRTHSGSWGLSHLSTDASSTADNGPSGRSSQGPPDERAWDAGSIRAPFVVAGSGWHSFGSTRMVLPCVHDRSRRSLPSVHLHVRNVAIWCFVRASCQQRFSYRYVPAETNQPRCLAHYNYLSDLRLYRTEGNYARYSSRCLGLHKRRSRRSTVAADKPTCRYQSYLAESAGFRG